MGKPVSIHIRFFCYCCVSAIFWDMTITQPNFAQDLDPRLGKARADWKARREGIKTARYAVKGTKTTYKAAFNLIAIELGRAPAKDDVTEPLDEFTLLLDFVNSRHRLQQHHIANAPDIDVKVNDVSTAVFDGNRQTALTHDAEFGTNPAGEKVTASIISGNLRCYPFREGLHTPLFLGHGVVQIHDQDMIYPGKLVFEPEVEFLHVHGVAIHEGRTCIVLRAPTRRAGTNETCREFWVDPTRDSAVLRQRTLTNQVADGDFEIRFEKQGPHWLVKGWTRVERLPLRDGTSVTFRKETMTVTAISVDPNVTDKDFQVQIEPGMRVDTFEVSEPMIVSDPGSYKILEKKNYRVLPNGSWQEITVDNGVERPRFSMWNWWYVPAVPMVGVAVYVAWRRWSTRKIFR